MTSPPTETSPFEIIDGIGIDELKDALQIVIDEYYQATHDDTPPALTGVAIVGSVVEGTYTIEESDLDVYIFVSDPDEIDENALREYMNDETSFGYGATAEVTTPQLTHVDLLGILETENKSQLEHPYIHLK